MSDIQNLIVQRLDRIADLLSKSTFAPAAAVENPYKEFTKTIANNETIFIDYSFTYFRLLTAASTTGLTFRFGQAGTPTPMVGAGIGISFPKVLDRLAINNSSGGSVTITVGLGIGLFDDNRLNISGNVSVINASNTHLLVNDLVSSFNSQTNVNVGTTVTTISATSPLFHERILTNLSTTITVFLGDTAVNGTTESGYPLLPGQSIVIQSLATISGITLSGTADIGIITMAYSV